jgi:ubiquinol-cytochrome c reductase cytochrome b subunit
MIVVLIVLSVYGKLPPTGTNAWIGFYSSIAFILLFVALPIVTSKEAAVTAKKGAE